MAKKINQNCTIYLVRHGETDANVSGNIQGLGNNPLNENGVNQAKAAARRLKKIPFKAAFSSDLIRAKKTAEILAQKHKLAVITTKALRERSFGQLDGIHEQDFRQKLKKELEKFEALSDQEKFKYNFPYGIENLGSAVSRLIFFLREISLAYPGEKVLVVSHGAMIRYLLIKLGWATYNQLPLYPKFAVSNLGYVVLECDGLDFFIQDTWGVYKNEFKS